MELDNGLALKKCQAIIWINNSLVYASLDEDMTLRHKWPAHQQTWHGTQIWYNKEFEFEFTHDILG